MFTALLKIPYRHARAAFSDLRTELRQLGARAKLHGAERLQLGAGNHPLPGWANLDLSGDNIAWDLTRPLPIEPEKIRFVYSEHFIEHVSRDHARQILANCYTVMAPGGIIRISTPDLSKLIDDYRAGRVVQMPHGDWYPETPAQMVNEALHLWGHQFLYDEAELTKALFDAGFSNVRRMPWRQSDHAELAGLETRPDFGDLILEATRQQSVRAPVMRRGSH